MTRLLLFFLHIFGSWHLGAQQAVQPPQLTPAADETTLLPGETLSVRCQGPHPVTWHVSSLAQDISERVSIIDKKRKDIFVSTLKIRDVNYLDVGYQSCSYVGTVSLTVRPNVSRVYLFVKDELHPLVYNQKQPIVTLTQGVPGIIPCRPSHPEVKVKLFQRGRQVELDSKAMVFRAKEGFVIRSPVLFHHSGHFQCRARFDGRTDNTNFMVIFNRATDSVQQPRIDRTDAQNAVIGQNFTLLCRANYEPGVRFILRWEVPAASTGLKTGRIEQFEDEYEGAGLVGSDPSQVSQTVVRRLLVTDTRAEDAGNYTCHIQDHNGLTNQRTENIPVYDADTASVRLSTDTQEFVMRAGRDVKIVVTISAYPSPDIAWYGPENELLESQGNKLTVTHTPDQTILQIYDLELSNMGQYKVVVTSPNGEATDSLVFNLTVMDAPRAELAGDGGFFLVGQQHQLHCSVTGYPVPEVNWRFKHCTPQRCDDHFRDVKLTNLNSEEEFQLVQSYHVQSTLTVTASQSGYYQCYGNNSDEAELPASHEASQRFFVSDIAGGFGISRPDRKVVAGDWVTLTCAGSNLAFAGLQSLDWYWSQDDQRSRLDPVSGVEGIQVVEWTTEYSYQKQLVLESVTQAHSGRYLCSGFTTAGLENRTETLLIVYGAEAPQFTEESNMDEDASIRIDEGVPAELNCTVTGLPTPNVTWSKDGVPVKLSDTGRVRLSDDGQRLVISAALDDDAGNYECRAQNREGVLVGSAELVVPGGDLATTVILAVVIALIVCLVAVASCLFWKCRQQKNLQRRLTRVELEAFCSGKMSQFNPDLPIDEQAELLPYDDQWEFPKERLMLGRQIGSGAFGRVLKAEAVGLLPQQTRTTVAVKMPKSGSDPNQIRCLMAELKIMIQLGKHLNVVNLLGAVTKHADRGEFMVLVEYCRHGNLHQYLHRHKNSFINQVHPISGEYDPSLGEEELNAALRREQTTENTPLNYASLDHGRLTVDPSSRSSYYQTPRRDSTASSVNSATYNTDGTTCDPVCTSPTGDEFTCQQPRLSTGTAPWSRRTPLTTRDLLRWSYQVARGMEYLASRKLLHGDLAARNILLAEDSIVKISDFGLSRDIYKTRDYKKKGKGLLPVKWMAIESIQESIFSTQSDVWAFGVVMWELFSLGATPYPGMEYDLNFVRRLRDGYRMEMPKFSPSSAYRLMMECWREAPGDRPSFPEICESLGTCLEEQTKQEYMRLNGPFEEQNTDYFARRADYVNEVVSPDYQNVTSQDVAPSRGSDGGVFPDVTLVPAEQQAKYHSPDKGDANMPLTDTDSYLLMSPTPSCVSSDDVFSPRPTAIVRPTSHFEFPPAPQLAPASEAPPPGFYNPAYHEAAKVKAAGGRVPSTPKMGTRMAHRPPPPSLGSDSDQEQLEHYRVPVPADTEHYRVPVPAATDDSYLCPVPVGCEQLT